MVEEYFVLNVEKKFLAVLSVENQWNTLKLKETKIDIEAQLLGKIQVKNSIMWLVPQSVPKK